MSDRLTAAEYDQLAEMERAEPFRDGPPVYCDASHAVMSKLLGAARKNERMQDAINYAAGSLEQSGTGEIPPIVIYDVIEHLRKALQE